MYFAIPHKEYLESQGLTVEESTSRLAIYQAQRMDTGWGEPELMPFSGEYEDYEPTLSPDGNVLLFNSKRPLNGDTILAKNNIWCSRKKDGLWQPAESLALSTEELEESYPSLSADGRMVYVAEKIIDGQSEYAVYETQFEGTQTRPGQKVTDIDVPPGSGDPWLAASGEYLIFTKFDGDRWRETCDLHIAFRTDEGWSAPQPLAELNSDGPDYAAAISPDEEWIFYRKSGRMVKEAFQPVLQRYRDQF